MIYSRHPQFSNISSVLDLEGWLISKSDGVMSIFEFNALYLTVEIRKIEELITLKKKCQSFKKVEFWWEIGKIKIAL